MLICPPANARPPTPLPLATSVLVHPPAERSSRWPGEAGNLARWAWWSVPGAGRAGKLARWARRSLSGSRQGRQPGKMGLVECAGAPVPSRAGKLARWARRSLPRPANWQHGLVRFAGGLRARQGQQTGKMGARSLRARLANLWGASLPACRACRACRASLPACRAC